MSNNPNDPRTPGRTGDQQGQKTTQEDKSKNPVTKANDARTDATRKEEKTPPRANDQNSPERRKQTELPVTDPSRRDREGITPAEDVDDTTNEQGNEKPGETTRDPGRNRDTK